MTVNERLYASDLIEAYDEAVSRCDEGQLRSVLSHLYLNDSDIDAIVSKSLPGTQSVTTDPIGGRSSNAHRRSWLKWPAMMFCWSVAVIDLYLAVATKLPTPLIVIILAVSFVPYLYYLHGVEPILKLLRRGSHG